MNVREYFETAFPDQSYIDPTASADLESMPLDSTCGEACKIAIDRGKALDDLILEGHGPFYPNHSHETKAISQAVLGLCLLYICG